MYELSTGTKYSGCCVEVAISGGLTVLLQCTYKKVKKQVQSTPDNLNPH